MADKRIQDLTPASSVQTSDRFVLEQSGQAKSLTGQILINDLAAFLDGHGGINDISYTPPSSGSLTGTLTITLADETVETFSVTNGRGITGITQTGTSGLEDTYQITYNDGSTPTEFTMTNGRSIESIGYVESVGLDDYYQIDYNDGEPTTFIVHNGEKGDTGDNWYVHIRWAAVMPTQDSDIVNYPSDYIGIYAGTSATAPTAYTDYDWYEYKGEKGDTGTSISSVTWESSSGLVDTYRVRFDDGNSTTFNVTNGSQINSIAKTSTSGLTDTYTVTLTNGNQTTFQVTNGKSIVSITWTNTTSPTGVPHVPGATDTYTIAYNNGDSSTFQIYNGLDGEGASITVDGIPSVNGNVPLLVIDTEHGAPTPQTAGSAKSRYFDAINSVLYICLGYDENNGYIWRGAGVTVDAALSTSSTNPVQNRVITNKIGTAALDTTAQDLSGAVNEILDDISGFADNLAAEYDPTATYAVGDLCLYDSTLYRCNTAISTPEAWNSIHWTATSVDEELDGKVSKSGDTMTGALTINTNEVGLKDTSWDKTVAPQATYSSPSAVVFRDENGEEVGSIYSYANTDGSYGIRFRAYNGTTDNGLGIRIDSSGNKLIGVSNPEAWLTAIRAVGKAGDTMTGNLRITDDRRLIMQETATAVGETANSNYNECAFRDKNDANYAMFSGRFNTDGTVGLRLAGTRKVSNTDKQNVLGLYVDSSGNPVVVVSSGAGAAWRSALNLGTSGALPITVAQGGSGQTAVSSTTTASQIATAATNTTISSASYAQWGKIAMVQIAITRSINTGTNTDVTVATLVSGKRPAITASATIRYNGSVNFAYINTSGGIIINTATSIPANTTLYINATYILP